MTWNATKVAAGLAAVCSLSLLLSGPAEAATATVTIRDNFFSPAKVKIPAGDTVQWNNEGGVQHTTTSNTNLWDSGTLDSQLNPEPTLPTSFSFVFPSTGKYPYFCNIHGFLGIVVVPINLTPATGTKTTVFTVKWAPAAMPSEFVEDVQIKRPGDTVFSDWRLGQTVGSSTFTPDRGRGTYYFQARLKRLSDGSLSSNSGAKFITVG